METVHVKEVSVQPFDHPTKAFPLEGTAVKVTDFPLLKE
jgi:hypothetical protein